MKPPQYPLRAVVTQREGAVDEARRALAEALHGLEREERLLMERESAREGVVAERARRNLRLYDPDEAGLLPLPLIEQRKEALQYLDGRIEEATQALAAQRQAVLEARGRVEAARSQLVEADKALRVVEKHQEGWQEERRRDLARREEKQSQEVVTARVAIEKAATRDDDRE